MNKPRPLRNEISYFPDKCVYLAEYLPVDDLFTLCTLHPWICTFLFTQSRIWDGIMFTPTLYTSLCQLSQDHKSITRI